MEARLKPQVLAPLPQMGVKGRVAMFEALSAPPGQPDLALAKQVRDELQNQKQNPYDAMALQSPVDGELNKVRREALGGVL